MSIYLSTRAGNLPRGRTSTQVGSGHEPLKRSVPFYSDNRAGIITDLARSDSLYRVFKTRTNYSTIQDGTFNREIGHDERDTLHTRTFIIVFARIQGKAIHARNG